MDLREASTVERSFTDEFETVNWLSLSSSRHGEENPGDSDDNDDDDDDKGSP